MTARDPKSQLGRTLGIVAKAREARAGHLTTHHDRPRVNSPLNDNYSLNAPVYAGLLMEQRDCKCVPVIRDFSCNQKDNRNSDTTDFKCKLTCCTSCTYCKRAFIKEKYKSCCCKLFSKIKVYERYFLCHSTVFSKTCNQGPKCYIRSTWKLWVLVK